MIRSALGGICTISYAIVLMVAGVHRASAGPLAGNAVRGAALYKVKCGACHSLDKNRIGPAHRGVVGHRAGGVPDFHYTKALKSSGIVWTPANLDRWLTAPTLMVKGTAMGFRLASSQDRADVIAYLAQISSSH